MPNALTYDCPYCLKHYIVWDMLVNHPIGPEKYDKLAAIISKQLEIGRCKWCYREDGIPNTLEMDGIYIPKDAQERFYVKKPCLDCLKYTKQDIRLEDKPCVFCGGKMSKSSTYWNSLRCRQIDRKLTAADRKKMGNRS